MSSYLYKVLPLLIPLLQCFTQDMKGAPSTQLALIIHCRVVLQTLATYSNVELSTFVCHRSVPYVQNIYASIFFTNSSPYITSIFSLKYTGAQLTQDFCTPYICGMTPLDSRLALAMDYNLCRVKVPIKL